MKYSLDIEAVKIPRSGDHSYIQERYPNHYREIRFAMEQCKSGGKVRGVEDESREIDPIRDHPPMVD